MTTRLPSYCDHQTIMVCPYAIQKLSYRIQSRAKAGTIHFQAYSLLLYALLPFPFYPQACQSLRLPLIFLTRVVPHSYLSSITVVRPWILRNQAQTRSHSHSRGIRACLSITHSHLRRLLLIFSYLMTAQTKTLTPDQDASHRISTASLPPDERFRSTPILFLDQRT